MVLVFNFGMVLFVVNLLNGDVCNLFGINCVFLLDIGIGISCVVNSFGVL